jgi:hypothetical protein
LLLQYEVQGRDSSFFIDDSQSAEKLAIVNKKLLLLKDIRFVMLYNEIFSVYLLGEVVQFSRGQRFDDHLCPRPQGRRNNLG